MSNTFKKNSFVIYDKTRRGFVTGYIEKGLLHGLVRVYINHAKIFKTAYEWLEWSDNNGKAGLTFSTFVNEFGFDDEYKSLYFNVIGDVLNFLKRYHAPQE